VLRGGLKSGLLTTHNLLLREEFLLSDSGQLGLLHQVEYSLQNTRSSLPVPKRASVARLQAQSFSLLLHCVCICLEGYQTLSSVLQSVVLVAFRRVRICILSHVSDLVGVNGVEEKFQCFHKLTMFL
jgi:hypothetical protein